MKDYLQDLITHTNGLGNVDLIKVTGTDTETQINAIAEDKTVIVSGTLNGPISDFIGVFGMPNLDKLNLHLKNPEYKENAKIDVVKANRNGADVPVGLHFENQAGDFQNDYRFMAAELINEKLKTVKFKGASWEVEFKPTVAAISRLKLQSAAHSEETVFQVRTEDNNLVFFFGDASTHAGSFVFQHDVGGKLKHTWSWPVAQVQSILNLDGEVTMKIADAGAMQITVDSGVAVYDYILPAQSK